MTRLGPPDQGIGIRSPIELSPIAPSTHGLIPKLRTATANVPRPVSANTGPFLVPYSDT